MDTYMVTLADRQTGEDQRVLVEDRNPNRDWQEWVDNATFQPPLKLREPVVMQVRRLRVKHMPRNTLMPVATASA